MKPVFLVGGGWDEEAREPIYGRFVKAATLEGKRKIVSIVIVEAGDNEETRKASVDKCQGVFEALGLSSNELATLVLSEGQSLTVEMLAEQQPTGLFVWGGLTPLYQEILCQDQGWVQYLKDHDVVYGGFSAGVMIVAEKAIVGGWKLPIGDREYAILDDELAEDLELLDVRKGLNFVPFSLDTHASQWGTITRLLHAIEQELVPNHGWAIDDSTMLEVDSQGKVKVWGFGQAYLVSRSGEGKIQIEIFRDGMVVESTR